MWNDFFFFFKQKTAYEMRISDWSSDVCSSDLDGSPARFCRHSPAAAGFDRAGRAGTDGAAQPLADDPDQYRRRGADAQGRRAWRVVEIGRASCRERVWQYV